jgi:hypothetical protein
MQERAYWLSNQRTSTKPKTNNVVTHHRFLTPSMNSITLYPVIPVYAKKKNYTIGNDQRLRATKRNRWKKNPLKRRLQMKIPCNSSFKPHTPTKTTILNKKHWPNRHTGAEVSSVIRSFYRIAAVMKLLLYVHVYASTDLFTANATQFLLNKEWKEIVTVECCVFSISRYIW